MPLYPINQPPQVGVFLLPTHPGVSAVTPRLGIVPWAFGSHPNDPSFLPARVLLVSLVLLEELDPPAPR